MSGTAVQVAGLWGYAEADPTLVAVLVAVVLIFAVVYLILRASNRRDSGAKSDKRAGKRG
jgi:hypothetical protein